MESTVDQRVERVEEVVATFLSTNEVIHQYQRDPTSLQVSVDIC
jgi:hypothetical protein